MTSSFPNKCFATRVDFGFVGNEDRSNDNLFNILIVGVGCHAVAVTLFLFGMKPFRESVQHLEDWEAKNL